MAGGYYVTDGLSNCQAFSVSTGTSGMSTVTSGTANAKGSYTQLTAATVGDATYMVITANSSYAGSQVCLDIAIGAGGSEQIIVANYMTSGVAFGMAQTAAMPTSIRSGSRISARSQSTSAADNVPLSLYIFDNGSMGREGGIIDSIGFVSATTQGATVDPGAVANTKGVYSQITASTAVDYAGFCFHLDPLNVNFASTNALLLDVAVGAAGSESIIIPNYAFKNYSSGCCMPPYSPWFDMPIRAGSRIAVRGQCASATSTLRQFGFIFYGLRG